MGLEDIDESVLVPVCELCWKPWSECTCGDEIEEEERNWERGYCG